MRVLAAGSRPDNPRAAAAAPTPPNHHLPHAPAAMPDLCASLPASAPRFRPAALSFRFSMVCGNTSPRRRKWLGCRDRFGARSGEEGAGTAGQVGGAGLGARGPRCRPPGGRPQAGGQSEFSVLTLRGPQPLGAARSVSSGENDVGCSSVGPHMVASR